MPRDLCDAIQSVHDLKAVSTVTSSFQFSSLAVFWSGRCGFLARLLRLCSKRRDPNLRVALYIKRR